MKNIKLKLIIAAAVAIMGLMAVFSVQSAQNVAIDLEESVETAKRDIKTQEKRRVDLIGNLVDCVKQYDKHESETLKSIAYSRKDNAESLTSTIVAVAEAYPELKSDKNYKELMNELATTENLIAHSRDNYNKSVKEYESYVRKFPQRIFLEMLGYEKQDFQELKLDAPEDAPQDIFK